MRFELPLIIREAPASFLADSAGASFYFLLFSVTNDNTVADAPQSSEESLSGPNSSLTTFSMYSCIVMITRRGLLPSGGLI